MNKPDNMEIKTENIPHELIEKPQWICWKWMMRDGKLTKPPFNPISGEFANSTDSKTWTDFQRVYSIFKTGKYDGIGFMLSKGYTGVDFDDIRDPNNGGIPDPYLSEIHKLNSYTEISPSGKGVKTLTKATLPKSGHHGDKIGVFDNARYFCITGHTIENVSKNIESRQQEIDDLVRKFWPEDFNEGSIPIGQPLIPKEIQPTDLIISKIKHSSRGKRFEKLWGGDISDYPSQSEADLALCLILAFWTNNDQETINDLFRQSGLYREKWDKHKYAERTITKAIALSDVTISSSHVDIYNNSINSLFSLYRSVTNSDNFDFSDAQQNVTSVTSRNIKDAVFYIIECLAKGGMQRESVNKVVEIITKQIELKGDLGEIQQKIEEVVERLEKKDVNLTEEIRQWVSVTNGNFSVTNAYHDVTIRNISDRAKIRVILSRMVERGEIERDSGKDGWFRRVIKDESEIDWESCDDTIIDVKWPLQLENFYLCLPKNIIVIAGSPDAGKTAFCLNFAGMNMEKGIKYFTSEMGALELKTRLRKSAIPFKKWKQVKFIERSHNFADVIEPDGINIVDYIEVPEEAWKIATPINEIFRKLNKGICVIALQKPKGRDIARGGESTLDRPRLYLSMGDGKIKIMKCKNWARDEVNPNGLSMEYKLTQGFTFQNMSEWGIPYNEIRR